MKIGVTAASGKLGSTIVMELCSAIGIENVIGIARTPQKAEDLGVELRQADYNYPADLLKALQGIDTLLLISGMANPEQRIIQHRNVINAAVQSGVQKIVYTSMVGPEEGIKFSPIVSCNRQTEKDIQQSGLQWSIGRNSLYIEPDLNYIDKYKKAGKISNSAAAGKCAYTSRPELAVAFSNMLIEDRHNNKVYDLAGTSISQTELAALLNKIYNTDLKYEEVSVKEYCDDRKSELGDFMGDIVCGIYEGIRKGSFDISSDYKKATGRVHKSPEEMIRELKA